MILAQQPYLEDFEWLSIDPIFLIVKIVLIFTFLLVSVMLMV